MFMDAPPSPSQRLGLSHTFRFSCRKGLSCFNSCCRNKHLPLTPYDVLRLKTALGLESNDFLSRHALYDADPRTGFPVVSIRMKDDPGRTCPFVNPEGCSVYEDRPTACRLFPLARAVSGGSGAETHNELYYLLDTPGCLGREEKQVRTVDEWVDEQGLRTYLAMNDVMVDFVLTARRALGGPLDERGLRRVLAALYDLDGFRDFVTSARLLDALEIGERLRLRVPGDDLAILEIGLAYLRRALAF